jgi:hypothetical protein
MHASSVAAADDGSNAAIVINMLGLCVQGRTVAQVAESLDDGGVTEQPD